MLRHCMTRTAFASRRRALRRASLPYNGHEAASYGLPLVASALLAGQLGWSDLEIFTRGGESRIRGTRQRDFGGPASDTTQASSPDCSRALIASYAATTSGVSVESVEQPRIGTKAAARPSSSGGSSSL